MNGKRKLIIGSVLLLMVGSIVGVALYYWYQNTYYVATEDAKVTGDLVKISPQISGKLLEFNLEEGQTVKKDQIIGRQEMVNLPDSSLDLATLKAPEGGIIIKTQGTVGEVVSPGQVLAMLVDPQNLYISANIEETKLERVRVGQPVDIAVDEFPGISFSGRVSSIGEATSATFSLLPTSSGSNFTKVVQKVPVKISVKPLSGCKLLPGINATVKIHVK